MSWHLCHNFSDLIASNWSYFCQIWNVSENFAVKWSSYHPALRHVWSLFQVACHLFEGFARHFEHKRVSACDLKQMIGYQFKCSYMATRVSSLIMPTLLVGCRCIDVLFCCVFKGRWQVTMKYWLTLWALSPSLAIEIIAYINGLGHGYGKSSVLPMELPQSCSKPLLCIYIYSKQCQWNHAVLVRTEIILNYWYLGWYGQ